MNLIQTPRSHSVVRLNLRYLDPLIVLPPAIKELIKKKIKLITKLNQIEDLFNCHCKNLLIILNQKNK